jgi:hypothetical protein
MEKVRGGEGSALPAAECLALAAKWGLTIA